MTDIYTTIRDYAELKKKSQRMDAAKKDFDAFLDAFTGFAGKVAKTIKEMGSKDTMYRISDRQLAVLGKEAEKEGFTLNPLYPTFTNYEDLEDAVYDRMVEILGQERVDAGETCYKAALAWFGFRPDAYDEYGACAYSRGDLRVAVWYDRGEDYWAMEPAKGRSTRTDDFYNTKSEMHDLYGHYGRGSVTDPWNYAAR
jgi:hypothetical protein